MTICCTKAAVVKFVLHSIEFVVHILKLSPQGDQLTRVVENPWYKAGVI